MQKIQFKSVVRGYRVLVVDGIERPVYAVRSGSFWTVTSAPFSERADRTLDEVHGRTNRYCDAKSLMVAVWFAMDKARVYAEHLAFEQELDRLTALAAEISVELPKFEDSHWGSISKRVALVRAIIQTALTRVIRGADGEVGDDHPDFFLHVGLLTAIGTRFPGFQRDLDEWGYSSAANTNILVRSAARRVSGSML